MKTAKYADAAPAPPSLCVRLLGGFSATFEGGSSIAVDAPRLQSLLAYVVLHRGSSESRERLAFLFWPDSEDRQARTNLRQALHLLRRALPASERFLQSDAVAVRWRADAPFSLDVGEFEQLAADAKEAREAGEADAERGALERAVTLYGGDLLPGCYDDWVAPERERLHEIFLAAAERLAELLELEGDYRSAITWARRLRGHDPLNEGFCRRLMRLYSLIGDRAGALRVYHGCATALAREIGVGPSAATREAYERLLEPEMAPVPKETRKAAAAASVLVGRREESEVLRAAWRRAAAGESLLALITGEAGIGKSRLGDELRGWVGRQGFAAACSRCYSAAGSLAYAPVVELLRSQAIGPGLRRLGDPWLGELARLMPELLDERPGLRPPPPLTDDWQRARLLDALSHAVLREGRPLLLAIDDLQWCDRETFFWLHYLLRSKPQAPLLLVATARSEELGPEHPCRSLLLAARAGGQAVELELGPLDRTGTAALARSVSGGMLDEGREELLYRETEGNPLFIVESVQAGLMDDVSALEDDGQAGRGRKLPPRADSVIEARLAQLSPAGQELAGLAATVGREFTFDVLATASSRTGEQVVEALDELWERRITRERGVDAYDFGHDKLREAAYRRSGPAHRRMRHRRVAQALERLHATDLDGVSSQLAAHYEGAGWLERSVDFYARAAAVAQRAYANEEAVGLLSRGLRLLDSQPHSRERDARELALRIALGVPLVILRGYGTREVTATYARAWELGEQLGELPTAPVVRGVGLSSLTRGELRRAHELGGQLLGLGRRDSDPMVQVEGHYLMGVTAFWLGDLAGARDHLEQAVAGYVPERARSHLALYSQDPRVICLSRLGYTLWYLGRAEEAEARAAEALRLAEQLKHPFSLAYALMFASWLSLDSGDERRARELAERLAPLAAEQHLGFLQPMGTILSGWTSVTDGRSQEGTAMIQEGLDAYRRSGQPLHLPWALTLLARLCLAEGRLEKAWVALAEAFEVVEATGQRVLEAELHRLTGELVLAEGGNRTEAESRFVQAIDIARGQCAVPLERRAAESLERLQALAG